MVRKLPPKDGVAESKSRSTIGSQKFWYHTSKMEAILGHVFLPKQENVWIENQLYEVYRQYKGRVKLESYIALSCTTLCDPMDCSLPGSSVHGIFQARVLEWVAISFSRGSSRFRNRTQVSHIVGRCFTVWATKEDATPNQQTLASEKDSFWKEMKLFSQAYDWYPGGHLEPFRAMAS